MEAEFCEEFNKRSPDTDKLKNCVFNWTDISGNIPLHYSCCKGYLEITQLLNSVRNNKIIDRERW